MLGPLGMQGTPYRNRIGYWRMDTQDISGTVLLDQSGNNFNGTLVNSPTTAAGVSGECKVLNGTNQYIDLGSPSLLDITTVFSVSAWIYLNGLVPSNYPVIIGKGYDGTSTQWFFGFNQLGSGPSNGTGKLTVGTYSAKAVSGAYTSTDFSSRLNQWINVKASWNGAIWKIAVDGILNYTAQGTQKAPVHSSQKTAIGAIFMNGSATWFLHGAVDEVMIFNSDILA